MKQQAPEIQIGMIVALFHQNKLVLGTITATQNGKINILLESGESLSLAISRILLISKLAYPPESEFLANFIHQTALLAESSTPVIIPSGGADFSQICHVNGISEDHMLFATLLFLKSHPELYYQKHELFFSRSPHERELFENEQETKRERNTYLNAVSLYIQAIISQTNPNEASQQLSDLHAELLQSELQQILLGKKIEDLQKKLIAVEYPHGLTDFILLIRQKLGDAPGIPDPALSLSGLPIAFSKAAYQAKLYEPDLPTANHSAFSIDDSDTKDYDDAISIQQDESGYQIGIHISNLAAYLDPSHPLFQVAQQRVSSLYLPSGIVPMLPSIFSEDHFSLVKGKKRAVLSLYARFDSHFQIKSWEWKNQYITVDRNLSYQEVDKNQSTDEFQTLINITTALRTQRDSMMEKTSQRFYYTFYLVDNLVKMKRIDTQSPSRNVIEELMILYNRCMADFATEQHLPMLFRNISQYLGINSEVMNSSAFLSSEPGFHPGIGAKAYLHATSPIRRWVDIINQIQVCQAIQGLNPFFDASYLESIIPKIERQILDIRDTVYKSERYWTMKYIEQNSMNQPLEATLKGYHLGKIKAEVMPMGKTILLISDANPSEEYFTFVPYAIDWNKQCLKVDILD